MSDDTFKVYDRVLNPIQSPGGDRLIAETYVPERGHNLDVRIILHEADIEKMLEVARASKTRRLVIQNASIRIRQFVGGDGHAYSCLTLCGSEARPEDPAILVPRLGASGHILK